MNSQLVKKNLFEVHKPSGQISAKLTKNGSLFQLSSIQFDSINFMCYKSREQMHKKYNGEDGIRTELEKCKTEEEAFNFLSNQEFELNLDELATFTNSYLGKNKYKVFENVNELREVTVSMGLFKKHDLSVEHSFGLIRRFSKTGESSIIKYRLEPEMMYGWLFTTKPFSKMYLKIQTRLKHAYSKILYENLKDYENQGVVEKPLKLWNYILGFDPKITKAASNVSTLKRDYLNKSIKDINENTDIFIDDIEGLVIDGEKFMRITFHPQHCTYIIDAEVEGKEDDRALYIKSRSKLDSLIKSGYKAVDEEMWIQTDIRKNKSKYEAEIRIDVWLESTTVEDRNRVLERITATLDDCVDPIVIIENYLVKGLFSKDIFTKSPLETIELLNEVIKDLE